MGGKSGGSSQQKMKSEPWLRRPLKEVVLEAATLPGAQSTGRSLVSGLTPDQMAGFEATRDIAGSAMPMLKGIAGGSLMGGTGQDVMRGVATGDISAGIPELLQQTAAGGMLGEANPYAQAAFQAASDPVTRAFREATMPGIDAAAARAGRLGSDAHGRMATGAQEELGRTLSNLGTSIFAPAHESAANRALSAAGQVAGMGQQDIANRLSAAGGLEGAKAGDLNSVLQALQGGQMVGGALMGIGGAQQAQRERELAERERLARQPADLAYENLQRRFNIIAPGATAGSVQSQQMPSGGAGGALAGGIGGAASGLGLASMLGLGGGGAVALPLMMGLGGILGGR